jgi:hypothetical protein
MYKFFVPPKVRLDEVLEFLYDVGASLHGFRRYEDGSEFDINVGPVQVPMVMNKAQSFGLVVGGRVNYKPEVPLSHDLDGVVTYDLEDLMGQSVATITTFVNEHKEKLTTVDYSGMLAYEQTHKRRSSVIKLLGGLSE